MATEDAQGPSVLVLGACGFIGRNFIQFLVDNELCGKIKAADSKIPSLGFFSPEHRAAIDSDAVVFKQADLSREQHMARIFEDEQFDYVFNLCGETRCSKDDAEYQKKVVNVADMVSTQCEAMGIQKWIEVSEGRVYYGDKKKKKENGKIDPWAKVASFRLQAEQVLQSKNIPVVILRPAYVYGIGDRTSLIPRVLCAATYKKTGETMKFLWKSKLAMNSVHVTDMCRAMWHAATTAEPGSTYNIVDNTDLTQGKFNKILGSIFNIKTGFFNTAYSYAAKAAMTTAAEYSNEKHVPVWSELCQEHEILNTPLSPFMDKELLFNNSLCLNGSAFIEDTGFEYSVPECTEETVREVIDQYINQGIFPPVV